MSLAASCLGAERSSFAKATEVRIEDVKIEHGSLGQVPDIKALLDNTEV
jgi:hypothetical protein